MGKVHITSLIAFVCFVFFEKFPPPPPIRFRCVALLAKYLQIPGRSNNLIYLKHLRKPMFCSFHVIIFFIMKGTTSGEKLE